jgi:hypothetical protein
MKNVRVTISGKTVNVALTQRNLIVKLPAGLPGPAGSGFNTVISINGLSGNRIAGNGSTSVFSVVHRSAMDWPLVTVYDETSGREVYPTITRASSTVSIIQFDAPPASGKNYKVTIA